MSSMAAQGAPDLVFFARAAGSQPSSAEATMGALMAEMPPSREVARAKMAPPTTKKI